VRAKLLLLGCLAAAILPAGARAGEDEAAPPLVIDRNHHLGPGDRIEITVAGISEFSKKVRLYSDGSFDYPVLKTVNAAGLTITELAARLTEGLRTELRRPQVTVTLLEVYRPPAAPGRPPFLTVLGAVTRKGIIELPEPRPLRTILAEVGPTENADLASIRIRFPDGSAATADFSEFSRTGMGQNDYVFRGGEELIILEKPPSPAGTLAAPFVRIMGQVQSPGRYELHAGMTLEDLILAAGKLAPRAAVERVELRSRDGTERTIDLFAQARLGLNGKVLLQGGDEVFVPELKDVVILIGVIPNPGARPLRPGQKIRDFFIQGTPEVQAALNPALVDLRKVRVMRPGEKAAKVDLKVVLDRPEHRYNLALRSGDVIFLPSRSEPKKGPLDFLQTLGPLGFIAGLL